MNKEKSHKLLHVVVEQDQYDQMLDDIRAYFEDKFDGEISDFKARNLLDFFIRALGLTVYNRAIQDAHQLLQNQLMDLESTLYEPDIPYRRKA